MDQYRDSPYILAFLIRNIQYILRKLSREIQVKFVKLCLEELCKDDLKKIVHYCQRISKKGDAVKRLVATPITGTQPCSEPYNVNCVEKTLERWPTPGKPWFEGIDVSKFIAVDVEGVKPHGEIPAHVCAVNFEEKVVFNKLIKYKPGKFNPLFDITGFTKYSLKNGEELGKVLLEFHRFIRGKILIFRGHVNDLRMLALRIDDHPCEMFDLQWHYHYTQNSGQRLPHSLKTLAYNLLNRDIQNGEHSAIEDAIATMMIFKRYMTEKIENEAFKNTLHKKENTVFEYNMFERRARTK